MTHSKKVLHQALRMSVAQ